MEPEKREPAPGEPEPWEPRREIVLTDFGGWISGPCLRVPKPRPARSPGGPRDSFGQLGH